MTVQDFAQVNSQPWKDTNNLSCYSDQRGNDKVKKQAEAELCQAQEKLGLAKTDLPVVVFHLL